MNKVRVFVLSLVMLISVVACGVSAPQDTANPDVLNQAGDRSLQDVYDDGTSTAYIRVNQTLKQSADEAVVSVLFAKHTWELNNPNKRIIAMATVTGDSGGYGHPTLVGLILHYEFRPFQ